MATATVKVDGRQSIGPPLPPNLAAAVDQVANVASLPEITTRIVQVVEDPRATARDMHEIVRNDPGLAAKILKVVNSAFYGLPAQIASLDRAILLLGLSAVKNIALAASLSRMFKADAVSDQFAARDVWRHCVAVGVCARRLASLARGVATDEAFVAGLVHDLGLVVAQQLFAAELRSVADTCFAHAQPFCEAEVTVIGASHEGLGAALAARWRFPLTLSYAIGSHHRPSAPPPEYRPLATLVYIADTLCAQSRFGFWLTAQGQEIGDEMLALSAIPKPALEPLVAELPARVEEAERILCE